MPRKTKRQSKNGIVVFLLLLLGLVAAAYLVMNTTEFRRQAAFDTRNALSSVVCTQNGVMTLPTTPALRLRQFAVDPTTADAYVVGNKYDNNSQILGFGKVPFVNGLGTSTVWQVGGNSSTGEQWARGMEKDTGSPNVYVSDFHQYDSWPPNTRRFVYRLDTSGAGHTASHSLVSDMTSGQTIDELAYPGGISVVNKNGKKLLFMTDFDGGHTPYLTSTNQFRDRVIVFDISQLVGSYTGQIPTSWYLNSFGHWGNPLPSGYRLVNPTDVLVDEQRGFMYVIDENSIYAEPVADNSSVKVFSLAFDATGKPTNATFLRTLGGQAEVPGSGNGQFRRPTGMALEPSTGNVYVVDQGNSRVQIFNVQNVGGDYIGQFAVGSTVGDIEVGSAGVVYTNDATSVARYACTGGGTTPPTPTPTPTPPPAPGIVLNKSNICQSTTASVNWNAYPGATGYEVRRCIDTNGTCTPNTIVANTGSGTRTFSQKLSTDQAKAYRFRVRARIGTGYSEYSNIQTLSYYICDPGNDN